MSHILKKIFSFFSYFVKKQPKSPSDLIDWLRHYSDKNKILDHNTLSMIEGILTVPTMRVKEVMLPRDKITAIQKDETLDTILPMIIKTAHSRFPVISENLDEVLGVLLAKDLLPFAYDQDRRFNIRDILREATVIPENKHLDVLLQEFRMTRNHMAIVVDEYGSVSGLITIEDVLEQIVGEIEDEYDYTIPEEHYIKKRGLDIFSVQALTPLSTFNTYFNVNLEAPDIDTIGGLVSRHFNHLPKRGETINIESFQFKILRASSRRIQLLEVQCLSK